MQYLTPAVIKLAKKALAQDDPVIITIAGNLLMQAGHAEAFVNDMAAYEKTLPKKMTDWDRAQYERQLRRTKNGIKRKVKFADEIAKFLAEQLAKPRG